MEEKIGDRADFHREVETSVRTRVAVSLCVAICDENKDNRVLGKFYLRNCAGGTAKRHKVESNFRCRKLAIDK